MKYLRTNRTQNIRNMFSNIQPVLFILVLALSLIEVAIYPGVIQKHIFIPALYFYLAFILITVVSRIKGDAKKLKYGHFLNMPILILSVILCISYFLSMVIEKLTYDNYIFNTIHIHPKQLVWPLLLTLTQYFLGSYIVGSKKPLSERLVINIVKVITVFLIVVIFTDNIVNIVANTKIDMVYAITHQNSSYDEKMEYKLGKLFYDYTLFIKANTPENSKILLPPFPAPLAAYPWPQTGNGIYMRYFLYPRTLVSGGEYSPGFDLVKEKFDYVLVAWGETDATSGNYTHGWPKFDVKATEVIYMSQRGERVDKPGDYVYKDVEGQELWGIIKVKK